MMTSLGQAPPQIGLLRGGNGVCEENDHTWPSTKFGLCNFFESFNKNVKYSSNNFKTHMGPCKQAVAAGSMYTLTRRNESRSVHKRGR